MTDRAKVLAMAEHLTTQAYYESDWPDKQREVAMLMLAADMLRESIGEPSQHRDGIREQARSKLDAMVASCK